MNAELAREVRRWRREPTYFAASVLGIESLWSRQRDILNALRDHRRVAVPSCFESGKTYVASVAVLWWLLSFQPSKVVTTAPTLRQVKDLLWSEIRSRHAAMVRRLGGDPGLGAPTLTHWEIAPDWFATGFATTADTASEHASRFTGYHSPAVLVVLDEAGGIGREVWHAAEGLMTSEGAKVLAIGQPTSGSEFERVCRSPDWRVLRISAMDCPNVHAGRQVQPWGVTARWVDEMRRRFGETSPVFQSRVLGLFPTVADDALIGLLDVEAAFARRRPPNNAARISIGCDVARFGSDETVIFVLRGPEIVAVEQRSGQDLMRTCGSILRLAREHGLDERQAARIAVDDTGLGGGVVDRLREQGWRVRAINFGAAPQTQRNEVKFLNRRTELWWLLREWVRSAAALSDLEDAVKDQLRADLCAPKYEQRSDGRIALEPKADIKGRLGRSPDFADALALAVAAGSRRTIESARSRDEDARVDPYAEADSPRRSERNAALDGCYSSSREDHRRTFQRYW